MGDVVFFTGFPGFLGKRIAAQVLADKETEEVFFLVQERFREAAITAVAAIGDEAARKKATIVTGDITLPECGLDPATRIKVTSRTTHAIHLAAAYNLALPRHVGVQVNVVGTRNVLDLIEQSKNFKQLAHISTCAISGSHVGAFTEDDFDVGQEFKNYYEETKYLSEAEVRNRWGRIPTVIFRPAVVVGDSKTGEAEKIDGPYYAYVMISRNMHVVVPKSSARFNVAPIDFVADALCTIRKQPRCTGRVFALSDPSPPTYDEFFDVSADAFGKRRPALHVPPAILRPLFKVPGLAKLSGIMTQTFDYSTVQVEWPCTNTLRALEPTKVRCPPYREYAPTLVKYFRDHLEKTLPRAGRW